MQIGMIGLGRMGANMVRRVQPDRNICIEIRIRRASRKPLSSLLLKSGRHGKMRAQSPIHRVIVLRWGSERSQKT